MRILIVDDERTIRNATSIAIRAEGHEADTADSGRIALLKVRDSAYDLVLLDMRLGDEDGLGILGEIHRILPGLPVVVFTAYASVETAVSALRAGAADYLAKPFTPEHLRHCVSRVRKSASLERKVLSLEDQISTHSPPADWESKSSEFQRIREILFRAADSPTAILILGESGAGKSTAARAVHERSRHSGGPFVTVRCPGLSSRALEAELFGHVNGSADGREMGAWGKVAAARGGTLFLDEISSLPLETQPKLLRLIQDREYERTGENATHLADIRVIAATNQDLKASIASGAFLEDLHARLSVIAVSVPPLRDRQADILPLADRFLGFFARQIRRKIDGFEADARDRLVSYPWPGNLRELRNIIERAAILCPDRKIRAADLFENSNPPARPNDTRVGAMISLEQLEREHITKVLAAAGSQESASRILGIDPATLYRKRKRWESQDAARKPDA